MRKPYRCPKSIGCLAITLGTIILLGMLLPAGFWWFILAVGLIICGLWLLRL
ncbi:MAG: hypothetical protein AB7D36_00940 [Oscillospiraceae bacterium]